MNIKNTNKLFQLFVVDPLPPNTRASYECDILVPRVVVDKRIEDKARATDDEMITPTLRIEEGPQNILLHPFEFTSEAQFNRLGIEAILKAYSLFNNEAKDFEDVKRQFKDENGLMNVGEINAILMSSEDCTSNIKLVADFCIANYSKLLLFPEIYPGYAYCFPEPEFFGVIPIETISDGEHYAIGIINSRPIVRVTLGDSTRHWWYQ